MENKEEIITEGLKYFKTSVKLRKMALRIQSKEKFVEPERTKTLTILIRKLNSLAAEFEEVEKLYAVGNKQLAGFRYHELNLKYADVLREINKDSTKKVLKEIKLAASTIAFMTIPYMLMNKFFPNIGTKVDDPSAVDENEKIKHLLKRSGAYILCSIPVRIANMILDDKISTYDDQIIKNLSNRFPETME